MIWGYAFLNHTQTAAIIKGLCAKNGISISGFLAACNIRKSFIYDLEKRNYTPSAELMESVADYFGCSVDYLLGRTENPETNR